MLYDVGHRVLYDVGHRVLFDIGGGYLNVV